MPARPWQDRRRGPRLKGDEMPGKPTIPRACEHCGATFFAYPSAIKRGGGRFCSRACNVAGREHSGPAADPANTVERVCLTCGETFTVHRSDLRHDPHVYCSKPCYFEAWRA